MEPKPSVASKADIASLAKDFLKTYDARTKDQLWKQQQDAFRSFWGSRVLDSTSAPLSEDECDVIIRILDICAKGNTKHSEAVARVMVPQGAWRRMLNEFRANRKLAALINRIFETDDLDQKALLIDELYDVNKGQKNHLTGPSANAINAFIAAYDPFTNLSIVSLNDRRGLIEFLEIPVPFNWENAPIGTKVVQTNRILYNGLQAAGVSGSARTVSVFSWERLKPLWKPQHSVKRTDKSVTVTVPSGVDEEESEADKEEIRESLQVQASLAEIGSRMGLKIWLPKSDRARILTKWKPDEGALLDELPLNYDDATLRTIEQIDVLWLRKRSIVRAFEVEHTTSVYSGILRMADLIALQPNMNINLHIVAPLNKREKVLKEIQRPVFSLLEGRALSEICTYLSYEKVEELLETKHLAHLSDGVIEDYAEKAE
jgi:hypothetical protein